MSPNSNRFDTSRSKVTMKAVVTNGNGGYEKLEYQDVPIPEPEEGVVLHIGLLLWMIYIAAAVTDLIKDYSLSEQFRSVNYDLEGQENWIE